ncbi:dihydrolipoamide acetyltransferase family protein [Mesoterricola sediminis]|uniref:Dihydrolipoamide acetyltransferase component of pyruvate dehydrogenase complex n=1 Tax=Mesoterricola sediminis TaxID=2927980 RepID=A0AA48GY48_9BACT|nr:dihydrolipoamide acetyltransferase family protein [Mesoterricola sediminis]BDU76545.1 dihydrolipoamide acetyltransferase component of pyruvate dehydrogenase complex [Mesoterricola sediminis]
MAFDVVMPQMGESIAEATILKWHRKVGETIGKDETLYEISTDKVDAEIPAPIAGTVLEILVDVNATVPVGTIVARLGAAGEKPAPAPARAEITPAPAPEAPVAPPPPVAEEDSLEGRLRTKSSPLVRRMAADNGVDLTQVKGSGMMGRVTKQDMEAHLAARGAAPAAAPAPAQPAPAQPAPAAAPKAPALAIPAFAPGERVRVEPMSRMRKIISDNMVFSKHTSAHVYTVFEMDMSHVSRLRAKHRKAFEEAYGTKLSFMPFVMAAAVKALQAFPIVNASVDGDTIVYKQDVNLGIAVSLDWGLIVPVVRNADQLNLGGLARAMNDLAGRARSRQLKPEEIQGGTFTITNPGGFGETFGLPIINQPQVAIMGMGAVKKRAVVVTDADGQDAIAIRETMFSGLTFDHRIIDGATADLFMSAVKKELETSDFGLS